MAALSSALKRTLAGLGLFLLYWASRLVNAWRMFSSIRHSTNISVSRKLVRNMRAWKGEDVDRRCLAHLRNIDPLLFEEVVLTALEETRAGIFVWRSARYSGDGGFDGAWWAWGFGRGVVQSKRYSQHVRLEHVAKFARQLNARKRYRLGLFVHTGKTGQGALEHTRGANFYLVSGRRLTGLVLRGELPPALRRR